MPNDGELERYVASTGEQLLETGLLPRQVVTIVGLLLQAQVQARSGGDPRFYNENVEEAYNLRDEMSPNTQGFVPTEYDQAARRTMPSEKQLEAAKRILTPLMLEVRNALVSGALDRNWLMAVSMVYLGAGNETAIGSLRPEDGPGYFEAMLQDANRWLSLQHRGRRTGNGQPPDDMKNRGALPRAKTPTERGSMHFKGRTRGCK